MRNYGKLEMRKETVEIGGETVTIGVFLNSNNVEWHDVFRAQPSNWYVAIDDNGFVISAEQDAEQSQIAGVTLLGLDDLSGFVRAMPGEPNSVYGSFGMAPR